MIVGAILRLLGTILGALVDLLPEDTLDLPTGDSIATAFGTYAGPIDHWFPLHEMTLQLGVLLGVFLPVAFTYAVAKWIYRHLPVVGKG